MGLTVNQLRKLRRFESSTAHLHICMVSPCGAAVAHSLGKTGVMGSIPITGSRGFWMMSGFVEALQLWIILHEISRRMHESLCCRLLNDRCFFRLLIECEKLSHLRRSGYQGTAAACLYPLPSDRK